MCILSSVSLKCNYEIDMDKVMVIDSDGTNLGKMKLKEAIELANSKSLDLVEVTENIGYSVCKITDYSKYIYKLSKKEKEKRQSNKNNIVKEIRVRPKIDKHDLDLKTSNVIELLNKGYKVKVTVFFRGREIESMKEKGNELLENIIDKSSSIGKPNGNILRDNKNLSIIIYPIKKKSELKK